MKAPFVFTFITVFNENMIRDRCWFTVRKHFH